MIPMPGLAVKLLIGIGVVLVTNAFTAKYVHDHVSTEYQNILLKQKVAVRTVEKQIAVLDTKTLNATLAREKARWDRETKGRERVNEIIDDHKDSPVPWCELSPHELRCWNDENLGFIQDNSCRVLGGGKELSGGPPT